MGYDVCVFNSYVHRTDHLALAFVDVLKQNRMEIVRKSQGLRMWKSYGACAMSAWSPFKDF